MFFTFSDIPALTLHQWIGLLGFCIYVVNYSCLSFRILSSESAAFFVINTAAASLVLVSLTTDFNLASALIQTFWIVIGTCAITLRLRRHWRARRDASAALPEAEAPPIGDAAQPALRTVA